MNPVDALLAEYDKETAATRRLLERIPPERFDWRPHAKSFTAGALGSHLVECVGWVAPIFTRDELDLNPSASWSYQATTLAALLNAFDAQVASGRDILASIDPSGLAGWWRLKVRGDVRVEGRRAEVFRDFTLSHMIHHRGQLSVYLRLLDVPVPGAYGPTADERP